MATITVFGGTGYAGGNIVREAQKRGHQVTSVTRSEPAEPVEDVRYLIAPSIDEAVADADVVIAALSPRGENVGKLPALYREIATAAKEQGARFIAIGGFSSLRPAPGEARFAEGELPPELVSEAREMNGILEELLTGEITPDWLFVSPAAVFGAHAPGEALGHYRIGTDVALFDEHGESAISGADFGIAVVDEVEAAAHSGHIHFAY